MLIVKSLENIDPINDPRWMPDGEDQWFLPHFFDLENNTYTGYWYTQKHCIEEPHSHSGISFGTMLHGEIVVIVNGKQYRVCETQNFFLPPNILHSAELIPSDKCFLNFGTVVGVTDYAGEKSDAKSYYERVQQHYLKHRLK